MQVIKDPIGTKGARLSTQISIAGRLLVFLPQDDHIGISQKIGSPELREQLRARMTRAGQARRRGASGGGFILRTNAEDATDDELADDIALPAQDLGARSASAASSRRPARCCTRT